MSRPIEETLRDAAAQYLKLPAEDVDLDMPVADIQDSLTLSEIVIAVEDAYRVELGESALGRVRVLRDLVPLVQERLGGRTG